MNIKLNYIETGSGDVPILLHCNGEESGYFTHQIEYFSAKRRVIAVDTRGHGKSPRGTAPFTIKQFAIDLCSFMDSLNIENADILGFSDGANIAAEFAIKYPHRVSRLILNGGNLNPDGVKRMVQLPIEAGYWFASKFADKSPEAKRNAEMMGLMVNEPNLSPEDISCIKTKTLVIAGTRDMIKNKHTKLIADSLPNSQLKFIKGDHFIANKRHETFNIAVEKFLEE